MNTYLLYGTKLIADDSTMKAFADSVIQNIPVDDLHELEQKYGQDFEDTEFEDEFMQRVHDSLNDDISRTDINYQELMYKYRDEIGGLLYEIENRGMELTKLQLTFFGDGVKTAFNKLIEEYVWFIKFCR